YAQVFSESDVEICDMKFQIAVNEELEYKPINDIIAEIGKSFIGTEYLAHGLEEEGDEQLVINLTGLDCTTLVENCLALSRCVKKGSNSFDDYLSELQYIRYRDGVVEGYPSRLHYFSDWITNNVEKGVIEDETLLIGGTPIKFQLDFMSTHPESYKQLKENPDLIPVIKIQEEEISSREYYYIPKEEFKSKEEFINTGDIIAITTTVEGLDIGHIGIAVKMDDGRIHLLHAPSPNTEVHITELTLEDYLMKYKRHSGVIVLRVLEPTDLPD
ncbi:MAG TPA: N-acetylmuramoyl-L-alanine amidase-like domain-containing protein, partial [Ignavibacteriaceae bacterium]